MGFEEKAVEAGLGIVAGVATGVKGAAPLHVHALRGMGGTFNGTSTFVNGATKNFQQSHKLAGAVAAGSTAVLGHGAIAAAAGPLVVAAAPVLAVAAVTGGAVYGVCKLVNWLRTA